MSPKSLSNFLFNVLPYSAVFLSSLFHPTDPDLGWYLKYGEYFFKNHEILRENTFSSQMADFRWANHSWGTDLISYLTFDNFGFLGLSILAAAVITATFYFFSKAAKLDLFEKALIFPTLIYFLSHLNSVSFRSQLLSLMLLGILTYILSNYRNVILSETKNPSHTLRTSLDPSPAMRDQDDKSVFGRIKLLYLLPILFALWSNLHGQFILGLAIFAIWLASSTVSDLISNGLNNLYQALKSAILPAFIFIASALSALVNPFGLGVYQEAIKHFGNPLEAYIAEWVPFKMLSIPWWGQILAGLGIFFGIIFLFFSEKIKDKIPEISTASILYLISFSVRRFVWPMYYFSIPLIAPVAGFFKPESKKYANFAAAAIIIVYMIMTFLIDNPIKRIQNMSWQSYCTSNIHCSDGALNYLKNSLDAKLLDAPPAGEAGNSLTYYGWGGYMIANYPEIKPSVDGRMTLWRDETGFSAFEEYFAYEQNQNDIDKSPYDVVLMYKEKPLYKHLEKLARSNKWQKVYEDQFAGIFVRK